MQNVDLGRTPMNIHFRDCGGDTYRVKAFLDSILEPLRREEKQVETILYRKEKVRTQEEKVP